MKKVKSNCMLLYSSKLLNLIALILFFLLLFALWHVLKSVVSSFSDSEDGTKLKNPHSGNTTERYDTIEDTWFDPCHRKTDFIIMCSAILVCCLLYLICGFVLGLTERNWSNAYRKLALNDDFLRRELRSKRNTFMLTKSGDILNREETRAATLVFEEYSIIAKLDHSNINLGPPLEPVMKVITLKYYLFDTFGIGHHHIHVVRFMKDVLKAVRYLHEHHIYHLDLQPSNILLLAKSKSENDYIAKVGGFDLADNQTENRTASRRIGQNAFYRAPEMFVENEVDAAKVDCWGIGITAFEAFTMGGLSIEASMKLPPVAHSADLLQNHGVRNKKFFANAMLEYWQLLAVFRSHFYKCFLKFPMYKFKHKEFIPDCWDFVKQLTEPDPKNRGTIEQALCHPLMQKVLITPGKMYKGKIEPI